MLSVDLICRRSSGVRETGLRFSLCLAGALKNPTTGSCSAGITKSFRWQKRRAGRACLLWEGKDSLTGQPDTVGSDGARETIVPSLLPFL